MDEYMALREVEATARFCELVLDYFGDHQEHDLGVACDLEKIVAESGNSRVGWHEGKVLGDYPLHSISDRSKEGVCADREVERVGRVSLLHARFAPTHLLITHRY
jgi:hypothetical protein